MLTIRTKFQSLKATSTVQQRKTPASFLGSSLSDRHRPVTSSPAAPSPYSLPTDSCPKIVATFHVAYGYRQRPTSSDARGIRRRHRSSGRESMVTDNHPGGHSCHMTISVARRASPRRAKYQISQTAAVSAVRLCMGAAVAELRARCTS